jgi:hypothetical protein
LRYASWLFCTASQRERTQVDRIDLRGAYVDPRDSMPASASRPADNDPITPAPLSHRGNVDALNDRAPLRARRAMSQPIRTFWKTPLTRKRPPRVELD